MSTLSRASAAVRRAAGARPRWRRHRQLEWNVKTGRNFQREVRPHLDAWLATHRPHAVVLTECYVIARDLVDYYTPRGWQVVVDPTRHEEARDVVIMVRARHQITARGWLRHDLPWVGPVHKLEREGRSSPWVVYAFAGWQMWLMGVHRIPVPGKNAASFDAESQLMQDAARPAPVGLIPRGAIARWSGDWNIVGAVLRAFAAAIGADVTPGHGFDAELHRAPAAAQLQVTVLELGTGGSDHTACLYTERMRRRRKATR